MCKTVLLNGSLAASLINFRGPLISALIRSGHKVHVSAPDISPNIADKLRLLGCTPHSIQLRRTGLGFFSDILYCRAIYKIIKSAGVDLVVGYTIKPNIWGSFAATIAGVKSAAMVTGLGYTFIKGRGFGRYFVQTIAKFLYSISSRQNDVIIFQNPDDMDDFIKAGCLADKSKAHIVNGSGVDLEHFKQVPLPELPVFLLIARLLKTKGIFEYVEAARRVKQSLPFATFKLAGPLDNGPDGISEEVLNSWIDTGIEYVGELVDVRPEIAAASVYVLPSYREGTPRTVLEAMSMGRPIITTDAPGCRETTIDGVNGYLVPLRDADGLGEAMLKLGVSAQLRSRMGDSSSQIVQIKYDVESVVATMMKILDL